MEGINVLGGEFSTRLYIGADYSDCREAIT
jgi:hypothetical protein